MAQQRQQGQPRQKRQGQGARGNVVRLESDKLLPHDVDAERGLLGSILHNNFAMFAVMDVMTPECFFAPAHREIYTAMLELTADQDPIDELTVAARMRQTGKLDAYGGLVYVAELVDFAPVTANALVYAEIVLECWKAREAIEAARELAEAAWNGKVGSSADRMRALLHRLDGTGFVERPKTIGELAQDFDLWFQDSTTVAFRAKTWCGLDHILGGIPEDRPTVVAARTGSGKSALVLQIARRNAMNGVPALLIDLEMGSRITAARALSGVSQLSGGRLLHKNALDLADHSTYQNAIKALQGLPLRVIQPREGMSLERLESVVRRAIEDFDCQIVLLDHLVRLETPGMGEYEKQTNRMRFVAKLQTRVGIPFVIAAQLNREGEDEPQLKHLKGSGEIEENAAAVVLLHDPDPNNNQQHDVKGIVAKNGNGRRGYRMLQYTPSTFTID